MRMFCNNRDCKEARMYDTLKRIEEFHTLYFDMKKELQNQQEQIQQDLMCFLDGLENDTITNACQIILERFKPLFATLEGTNDNQTTPNQCS